VDRDSSVGIAAHYGRDSPRTHSGGKSSASVQIGPGTHPDDYVMCTGSLSRG
jgi:hypothetical protein